MARSDMRDFEWDFIKKCNYSGTLTSTNRKRFSIFINNLPIYKSIQ